MILETLKIMLINLKSMKIYENILEIFKLHKVNMIIKFNDVEYIIFTELRIKN